MEFITTIHVTRSDGIVRAETIVKIKAEAAIGVAVALVALAREIAVYNNAAAELADRLQDSYGYTFD